MFKKQNRYLVYGQEIKRDEIDYSFPMISGGSKTSLSNKKCDIGLLHFYKNSATDQKGTLNGTPRGGVTETSAFVNDLFYDDWDSTNDYFLSNPQSDTCIDFDATANTGVVLTGSESDIDLTSDFAIEGWFYPDVNGGYIVSKSGSDSASRFGLFFSGSTLQMRIGGGSTFNVRDFVIVNRWHHFLFNYYIVDGVPAIDFVYDGVTQIEGKTTELGTTTNTFPLALGGRFDGTNPATDALTTLFDGKMRNVRIYDRKLPLESARGIYANYNKSYLVSAHGDSQLAGVDGPSSLSDSWFWKSSTAINAISTDLLFINRGVGGYDSYQGVSDDYTQSSYIKASRTAVDSARNISYLCRDLYSDVVISCYTSNDASKGFIAGPNYAYELMYNLKNMQSEANRYGATFIVVSSMPTADENRFANKLSFEQQKLCVQNLINFFDLLYNPDTGFLMDEFQKPIPDADGTHVNDYAHLLMSEIATRKIIDILDLNAFIQL